MVQSPTVTVNNGGVASCGAGTATIVSGVSGTQIVCSVLATAPVNPNAALGGSTKGGAKPPQTMIVTQNVTATAPHATVLNVFGTVTFGPGGTDTLPNSKTVVITVK